MQVKVDVEYLLRLVGFLARLARRVSVTDVIERTAARTALHAIAHKIVPPKHVSSGLAYFELLRHSSIVVQLELLLNSRGMDREDLADDEHLGIYLMGSSMWSMLEVIGRSVAHIHPTFEFNELIVRHSFGQQLDLLRSILMSLVKQGVVQSYKVVGSMEMLGDPVSLVNNMGTGVYQFFRKTGADLLGESETTGQGVKDLLQGVVGGTFGSVAKITGAADDLLSAVAGSSAQHGARFQSQLRQRPMHVGEGIVQGGERVLRGVTEGITGIVVRPFEGAQQHGVSGFFMGLGKGVVGVVASPVAGAFGAVSAVSGSVDANLKYWDQRPMGRRRNPRQRTVTRTLTVLTIAELEQNIPPNQKQGRVGRKAGKQQNSRTQTPRGDASGPLPTPDSSTASRGDAVSGTSTPGSRRATAAVSSRALPQHRKVTAVTPGSISRSPRTPQGPAPTPSPANTPDVFSTPSPSRGQPTGVGVGVGARKHQGQVSLRSARPGHGAHSSKTTPLAGGGEQEERRGHTPGSSSRSKPVRERPAKRPPLRPSPVPVSSGRSSTSPTTGTTSAKAGTPETASTTAAAPQRQGVGRDMA